MTKKVVLIVILLLAATLRLWRLSDYPAGLNADEAALGYNAYSLVLTGRDEHGHPWPINLESFGDFKPAGYAYLLIPFIQILGLTEFALRLPSAVFGLLSVLFIYLLAKEIFTDLNAQLFGHLGLEDLAAFTLAISPWHIHFSRGAWEVNVATTLVLISTWAFVRWLKRPQLIWLGASALAFALSMYTYQSARVIAPLIGIGLIILYWRDLIKYPKQILVNALWLAVLLSPLGYSLVTSDAVSRLSGVGLLADTGPLRRVEQLRGQHEQWNSPLSRLLHNRPLIYTIQFLSNYTDHFSGDFLFINGDEISRNRVPETGLLYLTDFILLVLGFAFLIRLQNRFLALIWLWLLIAPVAAAFTFQIPHALRAQALVIPLTLLVSAGGYFLLNRKAKVISAFILVLLFAMYSFQLARYLHQYYVHYPQTYPAAWEYGFKELVPFVESVKDHYDQILITDKYDQPYILYLFYTHYPPSEFQFHHQLTLRDKFNFSTVRDFGKFHFTSTAWETVRDTHSALIVAAPEDLPDAGVNVVKTIYFPNGQPAFKIVSN